MKVSGIVSSIDTRNVTTKYGVKPTYSVVVGGQAYAGGFKRPACSIGDVVEFDSQTTKYGPEIVQGTLCAGVAPTGTVTEVTPPQPQPASSGYSGQRKFPIDALSPERAIIRQNALTQARELVVGAVKPVASLSIEEFENLAKFIVRLAPIFEAYSSGDTDVAAVKTEMAAAAEAKVAAPKAA